MKLVSYLKSHRQLLAVGAMFALIYMASGAMNPYITLYYKQQGLSTGQIGVISAIGPLATLLLQTAWGRLADRTNRKGVLILALVASGVCALLYLFGASFQYILTVAVLFVVFNMAVLPMSDAMALEFCSSRGYHFAPIRMCGTIGYSLMPIALGWLFSAHLGSTFIVFALLCALAAGMALLFPSQKQARQGSAPREKAALAPLLRDPVILFLLTANFFLSVGMGAYTYLSLYASSLGFDNNLCGLLSAIAAIAEIPSLLLIDRVMKRFSGARIIIASSVFMTVRLLLTFAAGYCGKGALPMLIAGQLMQSVTYITNYYCSAQLIHERFPAQLKSTAQTLLAMVTAGFSRILANLLAGWLSEPAVLGLQNMFMVFAAILAAGLLLVLLTWRRCECRARQTGTQSM